MTGYIYHRCMSDQWDHLPRVWLLGCCPSPSWRQLTGWFQCPCSRAPFQKLLVRERTSPQTFFSPMSKPWTADGGRAGSQVLLTPSPRRIDHSNDVENPCKGICRLDIEKPSLKILKCKQKRPLLVGLCQKIRSIEIQLTLTFFKF